MSNSTERSSIRPHSSYDDDVFATMHSRDGVSIQCQHCPAQRFRRSRLRMNDLKQLFRMRYPVRCLRCSQRQMVSFTVAGISVPSHVKQRRARQELSESKHWSEPLKASLKPKDVQRVGTDEAGRPGAQG